MTQNSLSFKQQFGLDILYVYVYKLYTYMYMHTEHVHVSTVWVINRVIQFHDNYGHNYICS